VFDLLYFDYQVACLLIVFLVALASENEDCLLRVARLHLNLFLLRHKLRLLWIVMDFRSLVAKLLHSPTVELNQGALDGHFDILGRLSYWLRLASVAITEHPSDNIIP